MLDGAAESLRPPEKPATQVVNAFKLLEKRGDTLLQGRTAIPSPDIAGQTALRKIRSFIPITDLSPYAKGRTDREMFDREGQYVGGPYQDAAFVYFGIAEPGDNGAFDKAGAQAFELMSILQESRMIMMQATLDQDQFPQAMAAAQGRREGLREWVASYDATFDTPVLVNLQQAAEAFEGMGELDAAQHLTADMNRLKTLLGSHESSAEVGK